MNPLADRISAELRALIGESINDSWRAANMQMFGFGPMHKFVNRKGDEDEGSDLNLHIQCRWRIVDGTRILFGSDDLLRPADEEIPVDDFDWDKNDSVLDVVQRTWFAKRHSEPLCVMAVTGDDYGGFRLELEGGVVLEVFPCDSDRGEYSEYWRLLGHRSDGYHFVITGYGVEDDRYESSTES